MMLKRLPVNDPMAADEKNDLDLFESYPLSLFCCLLLIALKTCQKKSVLAAATSVRTVSE
jgi:hypothetical protein